jgi:ABC-type multidrug transport system permease subunit
VTEGPLWQLTLARLRGFFREPAAVFWTFGFPLLLTIALGVAFRNRPPEKVYVAVEEGPGAAELQRALTGAEDVRVEVVPEGRARTQLFSGKVALVVAAGTPARLRFDPTRPESRLARALVTDALERAAGRRDRVPVALERVTERGSRYIDFLVPGLIGMGLMQSGLWGIGYVIVEMRTRKLVKRLLATPMRRDHFLCAFALSRAAFVFAEVPLLLAFAWLLFSVGVHGSFITLMGVALLGASTFAAMGLLVASRAQTTHAVGGLINLLTLPMFVGSGVFFSAERFPQSMQPLLRALPLTALNEALRAVMLDGASWLALGRPLGCLLVWGGLSFVLALQIFRWR